MTKKEILDKLEILFFEKTYNEVSMQDVANILEMKKPSLYYHFESKETMFSEVLENSFSKYFKFLQEITDLELDIFIKKFLHFPQETKNLFSVINQNWYCENPLFKTYVIEKQKQAFWILEESFFNKYNFSKEKTFILVSLLDDIWRKKCIFWKCPLSLEKVILEVKVLFNNL